jgi:cell division transport system permease protein
MVISLLLLSGFLLLFVNLNYWMAGWGHSLSMSIYLEDGIEEVSRNEIEETIKNIPSAEVKRYISKEEALREFESALGSQSGLLEGLSQNPLPASIEVVFRETEELEIDASRIKQRLESVDGVAEVQYSEEWLKRFEGIMRVVRILGLSLGGLLCAGVLLIVTNTIKLTIYSRRDEIEILKLVGASDWFIKLPFLLEGMLQGMLSGIMALLLLFVGYSVISLNQLHLLGLAVLNLSFLPWEYGLLILMVSTLLGLIGSFIALGRFFSI